MQPLLAVVDEAIANFSDDATASRIYERAAELRQDVGVGAGTVVRLQSLVEATADVLSLQLADAYRLIGEHAMVPLKRQLEPVLRAHSTAHTCCLNLNALVQEELQPLVPTVTVPVVDVEMLDGDTLRISLIATDEMLGLMCGLLVGLASNYGQVVRFSKPAKTHGTEAARAAGRRYVDVRFRADTRTEQPLAHPPAQERRVSAVAVALQSLFR